MTPAAIISVLPVVLEDMAEKEAVKRVSYSHLMYIGENTARAVSKGKYLPVEYKDIIKPKKKDTRTADQVASDIIKQAGLTVIQ